jgi:anhydro-N-acetylmuramic acid kinase
MNKTAIGLMSGTSLDGIDCVLAEIEEFGLNTKLKLIRAITYPFENLLLEKIKMAISQETSTSKLLCSLNFELAQAYSKCVFDLCEISGVKTEDLDFIASHGQTIYHQADDENNYIRSSLQLGDGSVLANLTKTNVISNFRSADIALGGLGAPLVPYADYVLFHDKLKNRVLQNIGGIGNLTFLPANCQREDVFGFDTGPGNMMIDYAVKILYGRAYDKDGLIAKAGCLIKELFDEVMSLEFFNKKPPKTTGREVFGNEYTKYLLDKYSLHESRDLVATLAHVSAYSMAKAYKDYIKDSYHIDEIIVSGGGANNLTLLSLLEEYSGKKVLKSDYYGIDSNFKEALAFIILGNETLNQLPSNILNVTGAKNYALLGQISFVTK